MSDFFLTVQIYTLRQALFVVSVLLFYFSLLLKISLSTCSNLYCFWSLVFLFFFKRWSYLVSFHTCVCEKWSLWELLFSAIHVYLARPLILALLIFSSLYLHIPSLITHEYTSYVAIVYSLPRLCKCGVLFLSDATRSFVKNHRCVVITPALTSSTFQILFGLSLLIAVFVSFQCFSKASNEFLLVSSSQSPFSQQKIKSRCFSRRNQRNELIFVLCLWLGTVSTQLPNRLERETLRPSLLLWVNWVCS